MNRGEYRREGRAQDRKDCEESVNNKNRASRQRGESGLLDSDTKSKIDNFFLRLNRSDKSWYCDSVRSGQLAKRLTRICHGEYASERSKSSGIISFPGFTLMNRERFKDEKFPEVLTLSGPWRFDKCLGIL